MRAQQNLLARFTELSIELRVAVARLSERTAADDAERESAHTHQRAIEGYLARLVEESMRTRGALADELAKTADGQRQALETRIAELGSQAAAQGEQLSADLGNLLAHVHERGAAFDQHRRTVEDRLERLGEDGAQGRAQMSEELNRALARFGDRSSADADREALANLQYAVESQLAHLVEESARNRASLAEELKSAVGRLADRFADVDRDAMALHRRNIEAHLARLVEDTATNRTALADEIRGEIRLLARTIALARAPAQEQPTGD